MDEFTASQAAAWLGISREAVDAAAREGRLPVVAGDGPRRFAREALEGYHQARVTEQIAALARAGETPVSAAAKVRKALHAGELGMPRPLAAKLSAMPAAWRSLFSKAELAAACVRDGEGCRWCRGAEYAAFLGLRPPEFSPALLELFGGPPCGECGPLLLRPYLDVLAARVHAGDRRPPGPPPRPSEGERELAREWAARHAVAAAAAPLEGDDGRVLIAARLRAARGRLKDARRRGDAAYAEQLTRMVRDLEADAAAVDGRKPKPKRLAGVLRCGHALAAGCSCPRRAPKRARS